MQGRVSQLGHENWWLPVGQPHQYFWLSGDFFGCPGRTDNQNFERWLLAIKNVDIIISWTDSYTVLMFQTTSTLEGWTGPWPRSSRNDKLPLFTVVAPASFGVGVLMGARHFSGGGKTLKKSSFLTNSGGKTLKKSPVLTTLHRKMSIFSWFHSKLGENGGGGVRHFLGRGICPLAHPWHRHCLFSLQIWVIPRKMVFAVYRPTKLWKHMT